MIDIQAKVHDKFSIEFKVGFHVRRKVKINNFAINTWIFVPNSLDINPMTYSKTQFYRDVKSNVRLITPIFLLREIAGEYAVPLNNLQGAFTALASDPTRTNVGEYEYQIKMFTAIFKSALRDDYRHIVSHIDDDDIDYLCQSYIDNIVEITTAYRDLRRIINVATVTDQMQDYYIFGDEFIGNIIQQHTFALIFKLKELKPKGHKDITNKLLELLKNEDRYKRERGYLTVDPESENGNRDLVFRYGVLKKYVESDLFLRARKKRDGVIVEQIYYSIAAGLSMIFATTIAFSFQAKYGNFTMPLFVALVVSYMLKDRIKDLMRYYFAHRLGAKYFDNKTTIGIKDATIGWSKEGVDFISESKTPPDVMRLRRGVLVAETENCGSDEKILLYRKLVRINRDTVDENSQYMIAGINDIIRLNINTFIQKMDNPEIALYTINDNDKIQTLSGDKVYYLNIIMQLHYEETIDYKRFTIVFNRLGIIEIQEVE